MALWQLALLAFVLAWIVQSFGVWRQMQHYQQVFGELRGRWNDGRLGAGAAPAKLGKGAIALVVVDPAGAVRTVRVMQGRSVFAKFKTREEFDGLALEALKARVNAAGFERGVGQAISKAIDQIESVGGEALGGASVAEGRVLKLA